MSLDYFMDWNKRKGKHALDGFGMVNKSDSLKGAKSVMPTGSSVVGGGHTGAIVLKGGQSVMPDKPLVQPSKKTRGISKKKALSFKVPKEKEKILDEWRKAYASELIGKKVGKKKKKQLQNLADEAKAKSTKPAGKAVIERR